MPTGPLNRTPFVCYDCSAAPGTRHTMRCELRPASLELPSDPFEFAPWPVGHEDEDA